MNIIGTNLSDLFGGSVPDWFYAVALFVVLLLLAIFGTDSNKNKKKGSGSAAGNMKVAKNDDGTFSVVDKQSGEVLLANVSHGEAMNYRKENDPSYANKKK